MPGVDVAQVTIRGGTHFEFSLLPNPAFVATLRGIDMAAWYTTAWFDKYLKHDPGADARLLTDRGAPIRAAHPWTPATAATCSPTTARESRSAPPAAGRS